MAIHDMGGNPSSGICVTEPMFQQMMDFEMWLNRYDNVSLMNMYRAFDHSDISEVPCVTINGLITPEIRTALEPVDGVKLKSGAKRNMGTVPPQNMNKTVKTGRMRLGDRVGLMDGECIMSVIQRHPLFMNIVHQLLNMYPAGAPLTATEIRALEKGMLRPIKSVVEDDNHNPTAVIYSDGMLCTGYIQMLDDAIQIFKSYYSTLLGKCIKVKLPDLTWEMYPKRIVYDPSRIVRCSNPVINEAAQIALECDVIYNGVKSTGLLHLTSTATTNAEDLAAPTTEYMIFNAIVSRLTNVCVAQQLNTPKRCSRFITLLYILGLCQYALSNKPIPS